MLLVFYDIIFCQPSLIEYRMQGTFFEFFIVKWNYNHVAISIQKYPVTSFLMVKVEIIAFDKDFLQCQRLYHKPRHTPSL